MAKAYCSTSEDPTVGTDQRMEVFWASITEKFEQLLLAEEDTDDEVRVVRDWKSLMRRWKDVLQKAVNSFNAIYKSVKSNQPSGTNEDDIRSLVCDEYFDRHGVHFTHLPLINVLHEMPRFNPMVNLDDEGMDAEDDSKEDTSSNKINRVMGDKLPRPQGAKAAKKAKKEEEAYYTIQAQRSQQFDRLSQATENIAASMKTKNRREQLSRSAQMYMQMGRQDVAMRYLQQLDNEMESELLTDHAHAGGVPPVQPNNNNATVETPIRPMARLNAPASATATEDSNTINELREDGKKSDYDDSHEPNRNIE